jgi:hypothetical protein
MPLNILRFEADKPQDAATAKATASPQAPATAAAGTEAPLASLKPPATPSSTLATVATAPCSAMS